MSEKIFTLPVQEQITPYISQRQIGELPVVVVNHPKVRAAVTLQGAHLLTWQPSGEKPVLWLSSETAFKNGVAIRGGIPICWPWFGPAGQPAHGFARNLPWTLTAHDEDESGVILTFTLEQSAESKKHWPHDFCLIARFKLGEVCEMELESHGEYEYTAALHTYFNIGDITQIDVSGLGSPYIDKVNPGTGEQQGNLTFATRTDRIYTKPEPFSVITDKALQRVIEVHHHNNTDVVAWNPWSELSVSMADMPNDGYKTMVCVETAHVTSPMKASANTPSRLSVTLRARPLR
ncbi:D-hexose-6-phosphate mutarotase [Hafnia alvei]|uniref:D-hexose-6-phosphate mutarotase n=1 Tax=Hafnia alvei TaxID=569 RepID=UPI00061D1FFE|nr:D-hexose-6-phosphate mutarotase [Hafnia alvei]KID05258.2 glucose-6-phosphate 1-epimerase [Hafnia alvei]MBW3478022.1 D-hexose-6-phosphate mutarotase [Hafnia alvei]TBL44890.1 D-hexose-6-phosphate mutarotase [Hafnia alvei]TBM09957.1 D-hexose-6-phosphate mutarotase [Hafnia alvei]TBM12032.1 D-hexose-6-phosphate mutarotase [Hafnia alvei]